MAKGKNNKANNKTENKTKKNSVSGLHNIKNLLQNNNETNQTDRETKQNNNQTNQKKGNSSYVGAPYNFVSFSNKVYEYREPLVAHNSMEEDLQTGEITYEITTKTPIMVDDGTENFCKNAKGEYIIQGSTIRGLIRNNVQILGLASFNDDIDDYDLMYRNVANGVEKKRYAEILGAKPLSIQGEEKKYSIGVLTNVSAGYVEKKGKDYIIYKTAIDTIDGNDTKFQKINYYVLSERKVVNEYLKSKKNKTTFSYEFFLEDGKSIMQHELKPFTKEIREKVVNGKKEEDIHYIGTKNNNYVPYYKEISYEISGDKDVTAVGEPEQYSLKGYAMSTGKMNEKKAIYIIPEIDTTKETITILEKDVNIKSFQVDLKKRETILNGKGMGGKEFFDLPQKEGERKPIFYIQLAGKLYFGFTPRLRLFYDNPIKAGLNKSHKVSKIDYSKSLFGYSNLEGSYKSKLSFSDAILDGQGTLEEERKLILAEPKPTSYRDYLKPADIEKFENKEAVTYNDNFELRGVKQYWLREKIVSTEVPKDKQKVASSITPLTEGTKFIGKVRFQNLTKDELGLLLWSIRLNENSAMNIGKAKAYGYGVITVNILEAKVVNKKEAYQIATLNLQPFEDISVDEVITYYKDKMKQYLNGKEIDELPHIKEFFMIKDITLMPREQNIKYMSIERIVEKNGEVQKKKNGKPQTENEYQKRENSGKVLLSIEETIKGEKITKMNNNQQKNNKKK